MCQAWDWTLCMHPFIKLPRKPCKMEHSHFTEKETEIQRGAMAHACTGAGNRGAWAFWLRSPKPLLITMKCCFSSHFNSLEELDISQKSHTVHLPLTSQPSAFREETHFLLAFVKCHTIMTAEILQLEWEIRKRIPGVNTEAWHDNEDDACWHWKRVITKKNIYKYLQILSFITFQYLQHADIIS